MNPPSREELLSAYLDDELSADQRAAVEAWLAEDASYRQLYDELRALGSSMQSLPRHKLDRDLADTVLRRAERAVLAGDGPSSSAVRVAPSSAVRQWWSRRSWRVVAWPAVAAAAALAIALFDTGPPQGERQVAQKAPRELGELVAANGRADDVSREAAPQLVAQPRDEAPAAGTAEVGDKSAADRYSYSRKVAAPAPTQPAPPASGTGGMARRVGSAANLAKTEDAAAPSMVVLDVTPQFIEQRTLEKLLDQKKVQWKRSQEEPEGSVSEALSERDKQQLLGLRYVVSVTPAELTEITSDLSAQRDLVMKIEPRRRGGDLLMLGKDALRSAASAEARTAPSAKQSIVFWLRPSAVEDRPDGSR